MNVVNSNSSGTDLCRIHCAYTWGERTIHVAAFITTASGIAYAVVETFCVPLHRDFPFIVALIAATVFLAGGFEYVRRLMCFHGKTLFVVTAPRGTEMNVERRSPRTKPATDAEDLQLRIFSTAGILTSGLLWGLVIGIAPYVLGIQSDHRTAQILLAIFLFMANFVAGGALYSLATIVRQFWILAEHIEVTFFDRTSPSARTYAKIIFVVSLIAIIYIGLSQLSAVFSYFQGTWVIAYASFAILIFLLMYYILQVPIRLRLIRERDRALSQINKTKLQLLDQELNYQTIDSLAKLDTIQDRLLKMGLGLSRSNASFVQFIAVLGWLVPVSTLIAKAVLAFLKD